MFLSSGPCSTEGGGCPPDRRGLEEKETLTRQIGKRYVYVFDGMQCCLLDIWIFSANSFSSFGFIVAFMS